MQNDLEQKKIAIKKIRIRTGLKIKFSPSIQNSRLSSHLFFILNLVLIILIGIFFIFYPFIWLIFFLISSSDI